MTPALLLEKYDPIYLKEETDQNVSPIGPLTKAIPTPEMADSGINPAKEIPAIFQKTNHRLVDNLDQGWNFCSRIDAPQGGKGSRQ